jgi:hypothetical protein
MAGRHTRPIIHAGPISGSHRVDPALPCLQPFRLSGGRFCCEQEIFEPKPFGQQPYHFGHVCHPERRSADSLRSVAFQRKGKNTEVYSACVSINRHHNLLLLRSSFTHNFLQSKLADASAKILLHPIKCLPGQRSIKILVGDLVTGYFETLQYSKVAGVMRYVELELRLDSNVRAGLFSTGRRGSGFNTDKKGRFLRCFFSRRGSYCPVPGLHYRCR